LGGRIGPPSVAPRWLSHPSGRFRFRQPPRRSPSGRVRPAIVSRAVLRAGTLNNVTPYAAKIYFHRRMLSTGSGGQFVIFFTIFLI
jgi:hypothetical protein